ncbi:anaerobic ribonucleoside-triphosphate reductase [Candidatus Pyrohabitans sp.]
MGEAANRVHIVKASGEIEVFNPNMVTSDCQDAGIDFWTAVEVAQEVSKRIKDGASTREIQQETLRVLYAMNPEAAERYKRYHSMYVRTSRNTIEAFDRKKIVESLILETSLPREIAENIAREAEAELRRLKLEFISAPLIREVVNVKLLEHGFEEARASYTRLGMPVYDASLLVEGASQDAEEVHRAMAANVLKEFVLLKVLPLSLADAHMKGDLHIHAIEAFATKASSCVHDLRYYLLSGIRGRKAAVPPPGDALDALLLAVNLLRYGMGSFSTSQCLDYVNVFLAPYLRGLSDAEMSRIARLLLRQISQLGASCDLWVEYGVPRFMSSMEAVLPGGEMDGTTYGEFEEEASSFALAIARAYASGDHLGMPFSSPRLCFRLRDEHWDRHGYSTFLQLAHQAAAAGAEHLFASPRGNELQAGTYTLPADTAVGAAMLQVVTVNLPRIAYQSGGSDRRLFELLEDRVRLALEALMLKKEVIERRVAAKVLPLLDDSYASTPILLGVGYVGLNEMLMAHLGAELHREEALGFARRVLRQMYSLVTQEGEASRRFVLVQQLDENPHRRLARLDHGIFAHRVAVSAERRGGEVRYTPASWVSEDAELPLAKRLEIEGEFHRLCHGGAVSVIPLREQVPDPVPLLKLSRRIAADTQLRFWKYIREVGR